MGMFGSASRGLFGAGQSLGRAGSLVATPEEEERRRLLEQQQMGVDPSVLAQQAGQPTQMTPQMKQPNFWNGGGKFGVKDGLAGILAVLGDTFSQRAGGQGGAVQGLTGSRNKAMEAARAAQAAQARRQAELEDYGAKKKIDQQYPTEKSPYRWESNDGSLMELGPDGQPTTRYKDPTPKMNFIPDGMGGGRWVPLPTAGVQGGGLPQFTDDDWNSAGGGAGNGAGGFRYR